jgi:hypothetical protein
MGKRGTVIILLSLVVVLGAAGYGYSEYAFPGQMKSYKRALERAQKFVDAVNANEPAQVYRYLSKAIKLLIDQEGFVQNFAEERAYPYLTPLYLYIDTLELADDKLSGRLNCVVAARLPGQTMSFTMVFEDGDYYIEGFRDIADGSFLEKFNKL